jgi:ABC-type antimicrobial peptide transport system permease subunit
MAKYARKSSLIGSIGAVLVGAAILFFIITIILGQLKTIDYGQSATDWSTTNDTIDTLLTFTTIATILLGVMAVTMIGAAIIGYITGAF